MADKKLRPWFYGDRKPAEQLRGLEHLFLNCGGRSVLDVGCAEGVISHLLVKAGAAGAHGIEITPEFVAKARLWGAKLPCTFTQADANTWTPERRYDVVLCLALLHKLRDPSAAAARFCTACDWMMILRMKPEDEGCIIRDERSGMVPHDIGVVLRARGFAETRYELGSYGEHVHYFERQK
jgi:SAM-dependent methyltransferase